MIGMLRGMGVTIRHAFRPSPNDRYPYRPKVLPPRARSSFALPADEAGEASCKSCGLCAKSCPDHAITIESHKREDGPGRVLDRFEIDLGLCMYCGLCVENCPSSGLAHSGHFETSATMRDDTILVLYPSPGAGSASDTPVDAQAPGPEVSA